DQKPYLENLFPMIEQTQWLIWLMLTKRPQLANKLVPDKWRRYGWPKNAWPGTTAVTQKWWDLRVSELMKIPASRQFVSVEPLSEPINMRFYQPTGFADCGYMLCPRCEGSMSVPVPGGGKACPVCFDSPAGQGGFDL